MYWNAVVWLVVGSLLLVAALFGWRARQSALAAGAARVEMRDLQAFTRRTLDMSLNLEPGPQLAELIQEIFALEAVAVFDAELHQVYAAGHWAADPEELARNTYTFSTSDDNRQTGLSRRVVRLGAAPIGRPG